MSRVGSLDVISGVPVSSFRSSLRAMGMQPEAFVFGTGGRIRQSSRKIDLSTLNRQRGF